MENGQQSAKAFSDARKSLGLSRAALGMKIGYSPESIKKWEYGERKIPINAAKKLYKMKERDEKSPL